MKMKNWMIGLMMVTSMTAMAGDTGERGGNGGDVVICPDSVQLLDRLEAIKKKMIIDLPSGDVEKKVNAISERFKNIDPMKGRLFEKYAQEILADIKERERGGHNYKVVAFVDENLSDIDDSIEFTIPRDCRKEQLVIRRDLKSIKPYEIYQQEYIFNERLWDLLDEENKAMTVSHEAIYKITSIQVSQKDSRLARHLNGLLSSNSKLNLEDYKKLIVTSPQGTIFFEMKGDIRNHNSYIKEQDEIPYLEASDTKSLKEDARYFVRYEKTSTGYQVYFPDFYKKKSRIFYSKELKLIGATKTLSLYNSKMKFKNGSLNIKYSNCNYSFNHEGNLYRIEFLTTKGIKKIIVDGKEVKSPKRSKMSLEIKDNVITKISFYK